MLRLNAVYRQQGRYYVHDDPDTGKWTFPSVTAAERDKGLVKLVKMLVDRTGTAPLDLKLADSAEYIDPATGAVTVTENYLVEDWAGDLTINKVWRFTGSSELVRTGNADTSTRAFLIKETEKKTALYQFRKEASGPRIPHRSVSAVIEDDRGGVLLMEHKYQKIWSIPKGHVDDGETAKEALIRELEEELGINVLPEDAVMVTWYVEKYRDGDTVTPVKHYIYSIKGYDGKIKNAEKVKHGAIRMLYAAPDDILRMKDVSLMSLKAVGSLRKMSGGFLKSMLPLMAASYTMPTMLRLLSPSARQIDDQYMDRDVDIIKNTFGQDMKDIRSGAGEFFSAAGSTVQGVYGKAGRAADDLNDWLV